MQTCIHCTVTLHVSGVTAPIIRSTKTVSATSGIDHDTGTAASFQRGLIRTGDSLTPVRIRPRWKEAAVPVS